MSDIPHAINIYTDGSYKKGVGGSGIYISYPDGTESQTECIGRTKTTCPRAELMACVEAFKIIQKDSKAREWGYVCVHTDSQYIIDNLQKIVWNRWYGEPWKTKDGDDFSNKSLWQDFAREYKKTKKRIEFYKVKAHSGVVGNEKADKLAKRSRLGAKKADYSSPKRVVRRYLDIKENTIEKILISTLLVYVQGIKSKNEQFSANAQIIRPKKYLGKKVSLRGKIGIHDFHAGHIHIIKTSKSNRGDLLVEEIVKDIGRPSDNTNLWKQ